MQHQPATYKLFCVVEGSEEPFEVEIAEDRQVATLKEAIKREKEPEFANIDAHHLTLFRVDANALDIAESLAQVSGLDFLSSKEMSPGLKLNKYYPATPPEKTIHILIKLPPSGELLCTGIGRLTDNLTLLFILAQLATGGGIEQDNKKLESHSMKMRRQLNPPVADVYSCCIRRESTVKALYERLNQYRFVLVRGTPASGKSTLAQLLYNHILTEEPEADPILINSWRRDFSNWAARLMANQLTYWDDGFWNSFLKSLSSRSSDRVILFASYGYPKGPVKDVETSMWISDRRRISFKPVDHGDGIAPVGLFFTGDEFADMVQRLCPAGRFKADFLDYVLRVTSGHTGAVKDLLWVVEADDSYRNLKHDGEEYSLEIFHSQFPVEKLWKSLNNTAIFRRGLPMIGELVKPPIARVFRAVFPKNYVKKDMFASAEDQEAFIRCYQWGWLHATTNDEGHAVYIFATPLHQWFVEYYLGTTVSHPTVITD